MSERTSTQPSIRGVRLGGTPSRETERDGTEYAPRRRHLYQCSFGHETTVVFHAEATPPGEWECSVCPAAGVHQGAPGEAAPSTEPRKVGKTHWEQLRSRRTEEELEALLVEALDNYRRYGRAF